MDKNFTNEESLDLIRKMVSISRQNFRSGGIYYILFGSLFFVASLVQYFLYKAGNIELHWLVWPGAGVVAIFISIFLSRKNRMEGSVNTYLSRLNRYVWTAFMVSIIFVAFLIAMDLIQYTQINSLIIMLYGFATFIMGGMLKFKWLIIGAISAWLIAVICAFQEYNVQLLLVSLTILVSYLIPGLILNYSKKEDA